VGGQLTLISDEGALALEPLGDEASEGLPAGCEDITSFVDSDTLGGFAAANPDRTAVVRVTDGGQVGILGVVAEHMDDVRAELSTPTAEPCLEPVEYSTAELSAAQDRLRDEGLYLPEGPVLGSGSGNALNRLTLTVAVADRETVEMIAGLFDDPGILHFSGMAEIMEGAELTSFPNDPLVVEER
jgi:hypothetical protein